MNDLHIGSPLFAVQLRTGLLLSDSKPIAELAARAVCAESDKGAAGMQAVLSVFTCLVSTEKLARALTAAGAMYTKPIAMAHQSHGTKGILIHVQRKPQKVQFRFSTLKCPGRVGDTPGHGSLEPREWRLLSRGRLNGGKARAHACSWHAWHFESQG